MKKSGLIRAAMALAVAALILGLVYVAFVKAMPDLWPVLKSGSEAEIEAYLASADSTVGLLCTAMLQFLQVVSIILPGAPIQIAAGIVYGVWKGGAICYLSYVSANLVVFAAAVCGGSAVPIFVMCLIGGRILAGEYLLAVAVFGVSLLVVVLLTHYRARLLALARTLKQKLSR